MNRLLTIITGISLILLVAGCSGSTIVTPENQDSPGFVKIGPMPVWVSDMENMEPSGGTGILGLFSVHADIESLKGEMASLRSVSSADVLEVVDITNFLQLAPCTDCVQLRGIEIDSDGNLVLKIGIRHPFLAGDPLKPITGKNRADLHVFNVEGIVVSKSADTNNYPGLGVTTSTLKLLNADGYTGYLDDSIDEFYPTDANIHPFITHFADYGEGNYNPSLPMGFESVTDPPPSGNLVMPMGSDEDVKEYVFDLSGGDIDFVFAVGCTYAVSADSKIKRFTPEYRVPQHNKKAASYVNVVIENNELASGDTSSSADLVIEVLDINHGVAVGEALDQMRADSSVSGIEVEVSGVTSSPVSFTTAPLGGDGRNPSDPLKFSGTILNTAGGDEGIYDGIVKVTDSYPAGANESPLLNGMDGITRVDPISNPLSGLFAMTEFATYQTFEIEVVTGNDKPVAVLAPDPVYSCDGSSVWYNGSGSYDPDGTIVLYEFDFDLPGGDPVNFTADVSGTDAIVQSPPYTVGNYVAALRVEDNQGAENIDIVQVTITVIDGFDVDPYEKKYVTDSTFSNVIFTPNGFDPAQTQSRQFGLEAMATGSQYIYAVLYAAGTDGTGVYIARSGDEGDTWGDYKLVHPLTTGATFGGTAIAAVGNEIFIVTGEYNPRHLFLSYNGSNGDGTFSEYIVSNGVGETSISIAVDPFNTDNVYVGGANIAFGWHLERIFIYTSISGPGGTFTEQYIDTWIYPPPYNYPTQAYTCELKVAPDQDVYMFMTANYCFEIYRSQNFGSTFTSLYSGWETLGPWGRDSDYCFDPDNPETIYWVETFRTPDAYRHTYRMSTNGGMNFNTISNNLHGTTTGYTNCAVTTDNGGNLYIVYTDKSTGNGEVYGKYSTNGTTLGPTIQISNDPLNDGHVEITKTVSGCDVVVGWLEDRDGARRVVSRRG